MKFEEILLEAVDEGLSLLGESPKQMVYYHLEETFNINRYEIPLKIEEFTDAIEKIFGSGARILEIQMMKSLFKKLGNNFKYYPKNLNLSLTDYITAVKLERSCKRTSEEQLTRGRQKNDRHTNKLNRSKMTNGISDGLSKTIIQKSQSFL